MVSEVSSMAENTSKLFTNKTISLRLDESNYLIWKQQVLFTIESLALEDHIDGSLIVPAQRVAGEGGRQVINQEFVKYKQQDSVLCSWLLSSIGPSILPSLVNYKNALDI
ncbi:hypothetical protein HRI_000070300 [Hibiscus trionum]|uniref:Retrotransposon Copia-like N-terminal domain-containing protein n=1 Tax=Hibiscus trionum TaxID=183268 RepID=A0A9W7LHV0_HIBTR|nr:hypothetical protein HRI_000070300 [Hibiscus trionum]